jgi:hypothetical protein
MGHGLPLIHTDKGFSHAKPLSSPRTARENRKLAIGYLEIRLSTQQPNSYWFFAPLSSLRLFVWAT